MLVPLAATAGKLAAIPKKGTAQGPGTCFPLPAAAFFPLLCPVPNNGPGSTLGYTGSLILPTRVPVPTSMGLPSPW